MMKWFAKLILSLSLAVVMAASSAAISFGASNSSLDTHASLVTQLDSAASEAAEGKSAMINESAINSNVTGWKLHGKGRMEVTGEGLRLTSDPQENVMAISETVADDFIYEADVMVTDPQADATLLFRSGEDGWSSYMLQLALGAGVIRLKDASGGEGVLNVERKVEAKPGDIYHLRVKAEGTRLQVYWGQQYEPVIDTEAAAHRTGRLGLHVWNGSALFQNIRVSDMSGNTLEPISSQGLWQPDLKGLKGTGADGLEAKKVFRNHEADVVLEGDLILNGQGSAGLLFRSNAQGTEGYAAVLQGEGERVRVYLKKADGTILHESRVTYPSQRESRHHLEVKAIGERIQIFVDGYEPAAIDMVDTAFPSGYHGVMASSGIAYFQDVYITPYASYYTEKYRPQYHYSPIRGSASDPNGLVYFEGEYHLFHQDGGQWAHAVSRDLIHWKRLPIALPWNDLGHVWSGSAVADTTNASGLFGSSGGKGLIAYYTSYNPDRHNGNQKIGLAYSTDRGRTWKYSEEHPVVIENPGKTGEDPGGWDFRDPKVVRDEANNRWVMVVSGGDHIRLFTSTNLLDWTLTDQFGYGAYIRGGVWECPDLFQLPVEGSKKRKWVLMISSGANPNTQGSDAEYFIGDLTPEGKFINDNPAGTVLKTDWGKEYYASMSFSDMPDGRRIMLAWMTNWDYPFSFPTTGWKGQLSIPRQVSLKETEEGIRMHQTPIEELAQLRSPVLHITNREVGTSGENLLKGITSGAYEIEAELELPPTGAASEFGFRLREGDGQRTLVGYRAAGSKMFVDRSASGMTDFSDLFSTLHEAPLKPEGNRIKLRILVDESSVEVFGNDGRVVFSDVIFPDPASRGMSFYSEGGKVKVVSLQVHALQHIWREDEAKEPRVVMDTETLELSLGQTKPLFASIDNGQGKGAAGIVWSSSDPKVAEVTSSGHSSTVIVAKGEGTALITASTPNGKISSGTRVNVTSGVFHTNLTGWKSDVSASRWVLTKDGIRGGHIGDAAYMSDISAGNFTYEGEIRLGDSGGAGSLLFRASRDGRSGYYVNLDPNLKAIRLFYKVEGRFEERQVLARKAAFLQSGRTYRIKVEANGPHIRVEVDGQELADLEDGTFAEGRFGVHVFGGQAAFQHLYASHMSNAELEVTRIENAAMPKALHADRSQNGEPVTVQAPDGSEHQQWVLVPAGSGTYSIRTLEGKALDLDTGQNRLQLYSYLGFNNQRWRLEPKQDGTVAIVSLHNGQALEVSEDGMKLQLGEPAGQRSQAWRLEAP